MSTRPNRRRVSPCVEPVEGRVLMSAQPVDTREPVLTTTAYPPSAIVRLWVVMPKGEPFAVSGAMIDPTHVLTAAHNIYSINNGGWAKAIYVFPAQSGATVPLGSYSAVRETIYTDYALHETHGQKVLGFDVALLRLNVPVVPGVGQLGQAVEPDSFFRNRALATSGYPGDLPRDSGAEGTVMYTTPARSERAGPNVVHFYGPVAGGQSGSPLYWTTTSGTYLVGVVSSSDGDDLGYNAEAARLTPLLASDLPVWSAFDSLDDLSALKPFTLPGAPRTFLINAQFGPSARMHVLTT